MTETVFRRGVPALEPLPDLRTLVLMAQDLMTRVLSCFTTQGIIAPTRQVVYMAPVVADCEQLAVVFSGWNPMPGLEGLTHCDRYRWVANFSIVVTRCTPAVSSRTGRLAPTPEQLLAACQIASDDAEVMLCAVASVDEIGPELGVVTMAPSGGFQTVELTLQLPAFGGLD